MADQVSVVMTVTVHWPRDAELGVPYTLISRCHPATQLES